eukprot:TRINITY_DN3539_c0_g1_i1.p1 TRINITY_DN3539_c0_g1~~TRINITY_DN3539_c0_g1_i1.p1  ORF type:complete len:379 (+),score=50.71 TRINITY_DN3539_c0_g1_i1:1270-2406(+)
MLRPSIRVSQKAVSYKKSSLPLLWLEDNKRECINKESLQRVSDRYGTKPELQVTDAKYEVTENELIVNWEDESVSKYPTQWLDDQLNTNKEPSPKIPIGGLATIPSVSHGINLHYWGTSPETALQILPESDWQEVQQSQKAAGEWVANLKKYGFGLMRSFEGSESEVTKLAEVTANYIRNSIFGGFWSFGAGYEHADTAYSTDSLPAHVDGCYCYDPPGLQMLSCIEYDAVGGLTSLNDGFAILSKFKDCHPEAFQLLQQTPFSFSYHDTERGVHLLNKTPVIVTDFNNEVKQFRFNDCDRDPFPIDTPKELYEAWNLLSYFVKTATPVQFQLLPGTALIFDNWRLLHTRTGFTGKRTLVGCYLNMEDFHSRLRTRVV